MVVMSKPIFRSASALAGLVLLLGSSLLVGACQTGNSYKGGVYQSKNVRYRVERPGQTWRQVKIETADLAWVNDKNGASLLVNSHCEGVDDAPLEALTQHLLLGTTDRKIISQEKRPWSNREAMETVAEAKLDGVLHRMHFFVLKKDACVYDIALTASPEAFSQSEDDYVRVRDGFDVDSRPNRGDEA